VATFAALAATIASRRRPRPWATRRVCQSGTPKDHLPAGQWFLPGRNPQVRHAGTATVLDTVCFICPKRAAMESKANPPPNEVVVHNPRTSRSVEWYSEGDERVVEVSGVRIVIGFIGRKGRRARIVITAPAGATFRSSGGSR
jgi:hypothetical protein